MKIKLNDRQLKFGGVSLTITVLVIAAIVIFNAAFTALAYRFSIYTSMGRDSTYEISDNCISYIRETVIPKLEGDEKIKIYFCNDESEIKDNAYQAKILHSARELEEEAGVQAEKLTLLFVDYPTPGYTHEKIYIYEATGGKKVEAHLDDGEFLTVEYVPLKKAKQMLETGEIKDGKTVIALLSYFLRNHL